MWIFPQWAITIVKWVEGKPDDKEKKLTNQKKKIKRLVASYSASYY